MNLLRQGRARSETNLDTPLVVRGCSYCCRRSPDSSAGADFYGFGIPGGIEGFVWQNGAMKSLGALWCPCSSSRRYGTSRAFAVNNAGLIVGGSLAMTNGHGQFTQAFMFQTNRMDDVGSWEDGRASSSTAFGINDLGEIAGVIDGHPFVIHDGVRDEIVLASGVVRSEARAINRKGQIAGTSIATDGTARAFLRDFGVSRDLPPLPGDVSSEARAINVDGDVVGRSGTADFATSHAVLWRDGVAIDLNGQIDEEGWTLSVAAGINDIGQVVGTGVHLGQQRAFLLKRASRRLQ